MKLFLFIPSGFYDYLIVAIRFQRDVGHYILQQYMPCSYIVLLSWVCFWIEADCVGDRISIGVTLVLTIVLLQGSLNTNMPKVSYHFERNFGSYQNVTKILITGSLTPPKNIIHPHSFLVNF